VRRRERQADSGDGSDAAEDVNRQRSFSVGTRSFVLILLSDPGAGKPHQ
jgi:hypothetical protein